MPHLDTPHAAEPEAPRRRSGGRSGRRQAREQASSNIPRPVIRRSIPTYELLDEEALTRLESHAEWILREIGVEFRGDAEALRLFLDAGASVIGERVRFDTGMAKALCSTAPATFQMDSRDPAMTITLGGNHVVLMPGYGSPFVTDLERGRRYATLQDFQNFVKLTYMSPWLNHNGGTICEPVDIPVNKRHLDMVYAHLRYSTKPFMGGVTSPERAEDSIAMARLVFGDNYLNDHCVVQGNININSPLVYDGTMSRALRVYAAAGQSVAISPAIFGGAMGPVTQPAVLAQTHAETMAGIALSQLVRKGTPVVYGNFNTTLNLKSGAPTFGTPESSLSTFAFAQLGRRLGVPVRCGGQLTAANTADGQAMQESAVCMMTGILAGSNFLFHAAGWLEGGLTMSYEKFAMDLDHCGMMVRMMQGLTIDDNALAADAYQEAGPGQAFFGTRHTMQNFETANYISDLSNIGSFEQWTDEGARDMQQRAHARWKEMLSEYEMPYMDSTIDESLQDFVMRKKSAMPDEWY